MRRPEVKDNNAQEELVERVVRINRVVKVFKGGRRFSFSVIAVVGNGKGEAGYSMGKALEVSEAVRKALQSSRRDLRKFHIQDGRTIVHPVSAKYGAAKVFLKPCPPGSGIIASGAVRAVMEACGIQDISAKNLGSRNQHNVVKATFRALEKLHSNEEIIERRQAVAGE